MAAQVHFDRGREPAEPEDLAVAQQKGGLGQIHLPRHHLHPVGVARGGEQVDPGRIPREGPVGEGVHLGEGLNGAHGRSAETGRAVEIMAGRRPSEGAWG